MELAQDRVQWQVLVLAVLNFLVLLPDLVKSCEIFSQSVDLSTSSQSQCTDALFSLLVATNLSWMTITLGQTLPLNHAIFEFWRCWLLRASKPCIYRRPYENHLDWDTIRRVSVVSGNVLFKWGKPQSEQQLYGRYLSHIWRLVLTDLLLPSITFLCGPKEFTLPTKTNHQLSEAGRNKDLSLVDRCRWGIGGGGPIGAVGSVQKICGIIRTWKRNILDFPPWIYFKLFSRLNGNWMKDIELSKAP
jgi:hypothetical protein